MSGQRATRRAVVAGGLGALLGGGGLASAIGNDAAAVTRSAQRVAPPQSRRPGWSVGVIGRSVENRPIERWDARPDDPRRHVVVLAAIHGDERAMFDLVDGFGRVDAPADMHVTIVPFVNPDGWARATRLNARGVDLNRNFPWGWRRERHGGRAPGSEPETQAVMAMLERERPDLTVWVHQPLGYVAPLSGCPPVYADIWSDVAGVRVRTGVRQSGGGETWTAEGPGLPAMLVEVDGTKTEPLAVDAHVKAFEQVLFAVESHR